VSHLCSTAVKKKEKKDLPSPADKKSSWRRGESGRLRGLQRERHHPRHPRSVAEGREKGSAGLPAEQKGRGSRRGKKATRGENVTNKEKEWMKRSFV